MKFNDVIQKRRAVREYTEQAIDRETIEVLIRKAMLAPSAENHQPWEFAVLLGSHRVDSYAEQAKTWLLAHPDTLTLDPALQHTLRSSQFSVFYHAPALVIVLARSDEAQAREDCCLAAENFMLAARDNNLGTCWISLSRPWLDLPETKEEMGVPIHCSVVAPIVIGHPQRWPESHGRDPPIVHWLR